MSEDAEHRATTIADLRPARGRSSSHEWHLKAVLAAPRKLRGATPEFARRKCHTHPPPLPAPRGLVDPRDAGGGAGRGGGEGDDEQVASAFLRHRGATRFSPTCGAGGARRAGAERRPSVPRDAAHSARDVDPRDGEAKEPWNVQVRTRAGRRTTRTGRTLASRRKLGRPHDLAGLKLMPSQRAGAKKGEMDEEITQSGQRDLHEGRRKQPSTSRPTTSTSMPFAFDYLVAPFMGVLLC